MNNRSQRIEKLIATLAHPKRDKAARAESRLVNYGPEAVDQLIKTAADPRSEVRYRAAWTLGKIGDPRAYNTLLELTQDSDPAVSYDAVMALGDLGDPRAVEPLIDTIQRQDDHRALSGAAANALEQIGQPAVAPLIELLRAGDPEAKRTAAYTLGGIGDESAFEPLIELLKESDEWLRIAGIESLAELAEGNFRALSDRFINLMAECRDDSSERVQEIAEYWIHDIRTLMSNTAPERERPLSWSTRLILSIERLDQEMRSRMAKALRRRSPKGREKCTCCDCSHH